MKLLFVAWQDPSSRRWYPVGRLAFDNAAFEFLYTNGATNAQERAGFQPFPSFPRFDRTYQASDLFPLFANRIPMESRPDYQEFTQWLNLPRNEHDPIALLARSAGRRMTDSLEMFPKPEAGNDGSCQIRFFAHGVRYAPSDAQAHILRLYPGQRLYLAHDFQNEADSAALLLRTGDDDGSGRHLVGYCPAYLLDDAFDLIKDCFGFVQVFVEQVNPPPAPIQMRLLCRLVACWPAGYEPFASQAYQPIVSQSHAAP